MAPAFSTLGVSPLDYMALLLVVNGSRHPCSEGRNPRKVLFLKPQYFDRVGSQPPVSSYVPTYEKALPDDLDHLICLPGPLEIRRKSTLLSLLQKEYKKKQIPWILESNDEEFAGLIRFLLPAIECIDIGKIAVEAHFRAEEVEKQQKTLEYKLRTAMSRAMWMSPELIPMWEKKAQKVDAIAESISRLTDKIEDFKHHLHSVLKRPRSCSKRMWSAIQIAEVLYAENAIDILKNFTEACSKASKHIGWLESVYQHVNTTSVDADVPWPDLAPSPSSFERDTLLLESILERINELDPYSFEARRFKLILITILREVTEYLKKKEDNYNTSLSTSTNVAFDLSYCLGRRIANQAELEEFSQFNGTLEYIFMELHRMETAFNWIVEQAPPTV